MFKPAQKSQSKLRLALEGASGSGKTYSALILAASMGDKVAVIDTECGSASLYADKFRFDVAELKPPYTPERYIEQILSAEKSGYEVCIIDSLSHEWMGEGGILNIVEGIGKGFTGWAKATPRHDALISAILRSKMHIICTMRSKADYVLETNDKGKQSPRKVGTAPVQRENVEYEFTTIFSLNQNHIASVSKDRTSLFDGKDFIITADTGKQLLEWLNSGVVPAVEQASDNVPPEIIAIVEDCKTENELVKLCTEVAKTLTEKQGAKLRELFIAKRLKLQEKK